jgi:Holliday junction DNA helicase RuvA
VIASLAGLLAHLEADRCVIDTGGVGYLVLASTRTLASLPHPPEIARVLVETQVREDAITLYGFADSAERDWFRLLTTVQGVGAKVALGVLSALSPADLAATIAAGDRSGLTRAPGVGPRLADRILSELRQRAATMPTASPTSGTQTGGAHIGGLEADALMALAGLGFRRVEAHPVVARIIERAGAGASLDAVIRDSLRELGPRA